MTVTERIERLYREEWGRILAALIRVVRDFSLAEECVQDAFTAAFEQWPKQGVPANPRAWAARTARNKAVDRIRRRETFKKKREVLAQLAALAPTVRSPDDMPDNSIPDDRLQLVFTCCHPALAMEARVALTLRTLCGLTTEEIARAFLVPAPTMAQRLVRAKKKIKAAGIPYRVPPDELLPERLGGVMAVLYLVFNEGYAATSGELIRRELCEEAVRLTRIVAELMPEVPEVSGLLALMLLQHSRRDARIDGDLILLEFQDRSKWDRAAIDEGLHVVASSLRAGPPGPYTIQAAIAALHGRAETFAATDWPQIVALYSVLFEMTASPVVALNRAAAIALAEGPAAGLAAMEGLELSTYHLFHSARADMLRRLGRNIEAADAYRDALALVGSETERRFLEKRLDEVTR